MEKAKLITATVGGGKIQHLADSSTTSMQEFAIPLLVHTILELLHFATYMHHVQQASDPGLVRLSKTNHNDTIREIGNPTGKSPTDTHSIMLLLRLAARSPLLSASLGCPNS